MRRNKIKEKKFWTFFFKLHQVLPKCKKWKRDLRMATRTEALQKLKKIQEDNRGPDFFKIKEICGLRIKSVIQVHLKHNFNLLLKNASRP